MGIPARKWHSAGWLLLLLALPLVKWTEFPSWSMFMWAEDADLFLRQSIDLGARALVTPYAGYLHLYTRLVSWAASACPAAMYPAALAAGWWCAYLLTGILLVRWTRLMQLPLHWRILTLVCVLLQPHGGEVFFSATNAQWWLGLYLFIYFIWMDQPSGQSALLRRLDLATVVVASLSGPFALLVWPVILIRRWFQGRAYPMGRIHAWLLLAGTLQLGSFLSGERMHRHQGSTFELEKWATAFVKLLAFCADTPWQVTLASALVLASTWLVWRAVRSGQPGSAQDALTVGCCVGYLLLAGIWAHKFDPLQAVPLGTGNRYTWIPYALMFMLACRWAARASFIPQGVIALLILAICMLGNRPVERGNLQYTAFADFSRIRPVRVPVHPQVDAWPGWGLDLGPRDGGTPVTPSYSYAPSKDSRIEVQRVQITETPDGWRLSGHTPDPVIMFGRPLHCPHGRSVGVEVRLWRASAGWAELFWSKDTRFSGRKSLRRFYPAGDVVAQFAFPNTQRPTYLRLDPADGDLDALIHSVDVHCLPEN